MLLAMLLTAHVYAENLPEFFDSRDNPSITWLLLDNCAVPIPKFKLKDLCYIDKVALQKCQTVLQLGVNCGKN